MATTSLQSATPSQVTLVGDATEHIDSENPAVDQQQDEKAPSLWAQFLCVRVFFRLLLCTILTSLTGSTHYGWCILVGYG